MGLDIQHRGAVYSVEADDFENIVPAFQKFNGSYTYGVGSCRASRGEDADQGQILIAFGMHLHYGALCRRRPVHPINNDDMGKSVYSA